MSQSPASVRSIRHVATGQRSQCARQRRRIGHPAITAQTQAGVRGIELGAERHADLRISLLGANASIRAHQW
jgi:hypothetical protein